MGLFKPAWMTDKGKKADKALAAVGRMDDPSELAEVVLNAPLKNVAEAALERIHDEATLADLAIRGKGWSVASHASEYMTDQDLLVKVAKNAVTNTARNGALRRIEDQSVLVELACSKRSTLLLPALKLIGPDGMRELALERLDPDEIAYDRDLTAYEKDEIFKVIATVVGTFGGADLERAYAIYGDGCAAGVYAKPVQAVLENKKIQQQLSQTAGEAHLSCAKCEEGLVLYEEDYDTESGSWAKSSWFHCAHGHSGGGVRRNGDYEKPTFVKVSASSYHIDGTTIHLCPNCLKTVSSSPNACKIPECTCREKAPYHVVVQFSPAVW